MLKSDEIRDWLIKRHAVSFVVFIMSSSSTLSERV